LSLDSTQISDDGLAHLKGLTKLEVLSLRDTQISDNGLAHLGRMTELRILYLGGKDITDVGVAHLERMTKLEELALFDTHVSDNGLGHLRELTKLKRLLLVGNLQITDKGVKELQQALPNCEIRHSFTTNSRPPPTQPPLTRPKHATKNSNLLYPGLGRAVFLHR
jgi:hypothetical protein